MKRFLSLILALVAAAIGYAQSPYEQTGWLPDKGNHLVYDFCDILSAEQRDALERRLTDFNDSTSNQIAIIFTPAFGGRDISSFAFEVGDAWGIGQSSLSNGVLIVIKPKDNTDGQVEIATGTGLEGALPDIFCKRIIEDIMIPHFQNDDYYGALDAALDVILPVCAGEYSFSQYKEDRNTPLFTLVISIFIVAAICWLVYKADKKTGGGGGGYYGGNTRMSGWGGGPWGGSSGGSSWSGSSGSFGGFGGFGGGSFSGGGASGRW